GIDIVLLRLLVNEVAERDGVGEEVAADRAVDPLHLLVEDAAGRVVRRTLREAGKPGVVEEGELVRDEALGQRASELEERIGGEAVLESRDGLGFPSILLDDADGVEVLQDDEMDVV